MPKYKLQHIILKSVCVLSVNVIAQVLPLHIGTRRHDSSSLLLLMLLLFVLTVKATSASSIVLHCVDWLAGRSWVCVCVYFCDFAWVASLWLSPPHSLRASAFYICRLFPIALCRISSSSSAEESVAHTAVADACNGSDGAAGGGGALCELISRTRGSPSEMQLHLWNDVSEASPPPLRSLLRLLRLPPLIPISFSLGARSITVPCSRHNLRSAAAVSFN